MNGEPDSPTPAEDKPQTGGLPLGLLGGIALGAMIGIAQGDSSRGVALAVPFGICGWLLFGSVRLGKRTKQEGPDSAPSDEEKS